MAIDKITTASITDANITTAKIASGVLPANTPFFLANVTTGQTLASGTNTKLTGFADIYDTSNTFASDRFTPAVAGYYYLEGSVSISYSK